MLAVVAGFVSFSSPCCLPLRGEWPMLLDPDGRIALSFGVAGVPESFLISPDGIVVAKVTGGVRFDRLESLLDQVRNPSANEDASP
ncbi:hypothetical protein BH20ACT2_BH20ACT2_03870 [soil metagenome]